MYTMFNDKPYPNSKFKFLFETQNWFLYPYVNMNTHEQKLDFNPIVHTA